ncbi:thiolase family protein [uncultured Aquabacterium sp.]|uniref:thiolase family protein n=1 Tax=uncultured Aquabacterium sp. TaxID=158753 RepID=UPI002629AEBB|nr:thiolase family protein [uncultured Aquabacterium sp.]
MQDDIVILAARRTPIGALMGRLAEVPAPQLGASAIRAALDDSRAPAEAVDEVLMGCCLMAGLGQAPARQALLGAGLPASVPATTLTKMCGSGMKAVMLAHDALCAGNGTLYVAGGMESMSRAPHLLPTARRGQRFGHGVTLDHMLRDGLEDAYDGQLMGVHAERMAREAGLTRDDLDAVALRSVRLARDAVQRGLFADEIVPVLLPGSSTTDLALQEDETPATCQPEKVPRLRPAFAPDGVITAASSASISDGAAALVVSTASRAATAGWPMMARIVAHATVAGEPGRFAEAPVYAIRKVLQRADWQVSDVDLFEVNEAFAVVPLLVQRALGIPEEHLNVRGSACALGHPIGATGARILVTLLHALRQRDQRRGVASLCIGGGEATAMAIERLD